VDYKTWALETEIDDLRQIDIGLMPLTIDPWTEGKCGLKALQYMALAIPAVVSPVGVNTQIIRDRETGMLCNTLDEWKESLSRLIQDSDLRKTIGDAGREHVIKHYSVESNWPNFLSLFR
jgi:glycosyltransferase involved in cell wall biosynthesis